MCIVFGAPISQKIARCQIFQKNGVYMCKKVSLLNVADKLACSLYQRSGDLTSPVSHRVFVAFVAGREIVNEPMRSPEATLDF